MLNQPEAQQKASRRKTDFGQGDNGNQQGEGGPITRSHSAINVASKPVPLPAKMPKKLLVNAKASGSRL